VKALQIEGHYKSYILWNFSYVHYLVSIVKFAIAYESWHIISRYWTLQIVADAVEVSFLRDIAAVAWWQLFINWCIHVNVLD